MKPYTDSYYRERYKTSLPSAERIVPLVVELLAPRSVIDLGCGDGALTEKLIAAGCNVVAIDSSPEQVWAALERGIDARILDSTVLGFEGEFDAIFQTQFYTGSQMSTVC